MFTHLLVFLVLQVVFAQPPKMQATATVDPNRANEWPQKEAVPATVHGVSQQAPHSGRACVYVEWAMGRTVVRQGKESWVSFDRPTASREALVFRTKGRDQLRVHPSIVRFFLSPSFERAATDSDDPTHSGTESLTIKEYCLREGESVYVERIQGVHLLPPDTETGPPKEEVYEQFRVTSSSNQTEPTPTSMLR